jgi:hypothetical protein
MTMTVTVSMRMVVWSSYNMSLEAIVVRRVVDVSPASVSLKFQTKICHYSSRNF